MDLLVDTRLVFIMKYGNTTGTAIYRDQTLHLPIRCRKNSWLHLMHRNECNAVRGRTSKDVDAARLVFLFELCIPACTCNVYVCMHAPWKFLKFLELRRDRCPLCVCVLETGLDVHVATLQGQKKKKKQRKVLTNEQ
jgi:hypothetical protein